jgi:PTS system nitrogen regulatory IIA component
MELAKILQPDAVRLISMCSSKKRLFQDLSETAETAYGIDAKTAIEARQERESLGPTGVGNGIALPHARLDGLTQVVGVFIRLEKSLDFEAVDRQPVDLVFALFAPKNSGVAHLKALAAVSRTMRDSSICSKLRANNVATTLHTIITENASAKAA